MLAYRDGDATAFDRLYLRWRGRLYRYLAHQAVDHADELFQEVWMRIIGARTQYEVSAKFSTWLFRIAHNRLIDHLRAHNRNVVKLFDMDDEQITLEEYTPAKEEDEPLPMLQRREAARYIMVAVAALPAPQREAFLMQEEGRMTLEEIAHAAGVGRETIKSRLRYAYARLRASLAGMRSDSHA